MDEFANPFSPGAGTSPRALLSFAPQVTPTTPLRRS
jgi:hypothetical protein